MSDRARELMRRAVWKDLATRFTVEMGRGATYVTGKPTLYAHGTYPASSVLAGQPSRTFLGTWETWEQARQAIDEIRAEYPGVDIAIEAGSSYIPHDEILRAAGLHEGRDE